MVKWSHLRQLASAIARKQEGACAGAVLPRRLHVQAQRLQALERKCQNHISCGAGGGQSGWQG